ncbi:MAG: molybdopterin-synthase adenylyltransferase MoeB [Pseudomonadota bacterium]|nr:molybdopterin-synthase adenylyltransferase MoeB [Pseudomonadota bacterium]
MPRPLSSTALKLSKEEVRRYSRHLLMPQVKMEGQLKLKAARVLIIGTGGLGAPLGLYLAAAGIGMLGLVDFDVVDASNLQRQVIFTNDDIGRPKVEAARDHLSKLNHYIEIMSYNELFTSQNALRIMQEYDVIVDATDNFPTRYLINDACVFTQKPYVYGSIFQHEGQVTVFAKSDGPCYRCLFPEPPPPGMVPSCAEGGVLGVLPGIIGSLQANEALNLILNIGEGLAGRLVRFDAINVRFKELKIKKNPNCPVCGANPSITKLIDYEEFCGLSDKNATHEGQEIEPILLKQWLDRNEQVSLVDVREPGEYEICNLGGQLIPLYEIPLRMHEFDSSLRIVILCSGGQRSARAVELLRKSGFKNVWNLKGGLFAWSDQIDPTFVKY